MPQDGFSAADMIFRLDRMRRRYIAAELGGYGLRGSMPNLLLMLSHHPGRSQDEVATRLALDKGNAARMIGALEEMGYLKRETDQRDRRRNCLYLSEAGENLLPTIRSVFESWDKSISMSMTREESAIALRLIRKLYEGARAQESLD